MTYGKSNELESQKSETCKMAIEQFIREITLAYTTYKLKIILCF